MYFMALQATHIYCRNTIAVLGQKLLWSRAWLLEGVTAGGVMNTSKGNPYQKVLFGSWFASQGEGHPRRPSAVTRRVPPTLISPGCHVSPGAISPCPASPQQGWSRALHSTAQPGHRPQWAGPPQPGHSMSQGSAWCLGLGLLLAAQLLAGQRDRPGLGEPLLISVQGTNSPPGLWH